ncbi:G-type lectin S-receptor-like serine/threonine-protein kinase At1g34300 [Macadamia integrifolia]|uniref:G-type lectin S-receptor-like serine/threonine-protein kinase At1g34300 n=1 Tax=Macadamia integrifolia TaxID=60698 RepID=UPI001C4E9B78|nr:G-type lectin S-receptor-like serine/threonine-protein kinase At1g34300 [Macadamia integrifolia]
MRKAVRNFSLLFSILIFSLSPLTAQQQQQKLSYFSISNSPWSPAMNQTLVSSNSTFAAGFRPLTTSPYLYIFAVWFLYGIDKTVIWSLNGTTSSPVDQSSSLVITPAGILQLNDSTGHNLWQPTAFGDPKQTKLVLGEDGNLVFGNWSSFNYPTDTILPNQTIDGMILVSKNGKYMFRNNQDLVFNSSNVYMTLSPAIGIMHSLGTITMKNSDHSYVMADLGDLRLRRLTLDNDGNLRAYSLRPVSGTWMIVWQAIQELCTIHGTCGPNYVCMSNGSNSTFCVCPPGFEVQTGVVGEQICERRIPITPKDSKFLRLDFVSFIGGQYLQAPNFTSCEDGCVANSSCIAYAVQFNGNHYCIHHQRLHYGYWSPYPQVTTFLRISNSETNISNNFTGMTTKVDTICPTLISLPVPPNRSQTTTRNIIILSSVFSIEFIVCFLSFWAFLNKYRKYQDMAWSLGLELLPAGGPKRFSYAELKTATNNFSTIIGQGGFGIVYKGELPDHRSIAVKRLKKVTGAETEFWGEITIIARMHHLNLVRVWGFCVEKDHKMLVYEYIPNGSLAKYLFPAHSPAIPESGQGRSSRDLPSNSNTTTNSDSFSSSNCIENIPLKPLLDRTEKTQLRPLLDWDVRYRIALGIARAIAYLHEECLEWVLHCDIKPENILLGDDFCPKVSDFGLSKLTKKEEMVAMSRIHGTRGYLAPEWVTREQPITAKADVYSFGMVLLEIVSGSRNFQSRESLSEDWYFPRWAYEKVYEEKMVEDLLDKTIIHCYDIKVHIEFVDRMVKTAIWCLQERPDLRPSMGKVAKMLEGTVEITEPPKPTIFYLEMGDKTLFLL